MNNPENDKRKTRRNLMVGGVATLAAAEGLQWTKPVVQTVFLPAHAQTSGITSQTIFGRLENRAPPGSNDVDTGGVCFRFMVLQDGTAFNYRAESPGGAPEAGLQTEEQFNDPDGTAFAKSDTDSPGEVAANGTTLDTGTYYLCYEDSRRSNANESPVDFRIDVTTDKPITPLEKAFEGDERL